jgi:tetratricopeptide (TPR) repeat protein
VHHGRLTLPLILLVVSSLIGCGGRAAPRRPAAVTIAAIERAEAHEAARRHDLARAEYQRAIAEAPDRPSELHARLELAEQLAVWGEVGDAATQLEAALAIDPGLARAWHDLGVLRHHLGDDPGARAALDRAIALAPRDPRPRIALAALLWQGGDRAGARAQYEALLELDLPDPVRAKVRWAIDQLGDPP